MWRDFPARMAAKLGLRAMAYTRAGYGASDPVDLPRPLTYLRHEAETVLPDLLETLGLTDVVLIGHSDGGTIALMAAAAGLPGLRGVVSMAAHVFNEPMTVRGIEVAKQSYVTGNLREKLRRHHGENVDCAFWGWCDAWLDPAFWDWSMLGDIARIRVPVLALQGDGDEYGSETQVDRILSGLSGKGEKVILPDCGHAPHQQSVKVTMAAICRFLSENLILV